MTKKQSIIVFGANEMIWELAMAGTVAELVGMGYDVKLSYS